MVMEVVAVVIVIVGDRRRGIGEWENDGICENGGVVIMAYSHLLLLLMMMMMMMMQCSYLQQ